LSGAVITALMFTGPLGSLAPRTAARSCCPVPPPRAQRTNCLQAEIEGLRAVFPAPRTVSAAPANLPFQQSSFIGRGEERREGGALLRRARLLTLTGSGGAGKTRLALKLATDAAVDFPDGICFVALAPVNDPELVGASLAHALGLADNGRAPIRDVVVDYLTDKRVLLLLDNFERLLAAAGVVGDLLDRTPNVKVLVTSRARLRVSGEQLLEVRPLSLEARAAPNDSATVASEAATLFVARAREVMPTLALDRERSNAIEAVCARLDGLPLAIELAAARVRVLPPVAMLQRLQEPLNLLTAGPRDRPARQHSLRNTIAWSYDLLDDPTRTVFACFSVFGGGAELTILDQVCPPRCAVLDGVTQLVEHSLVHPVETDDQHRFTMLATIRDFAAERLADSPDAGNVRHRHANAFLGLAETAASKILLGHGRDWIDRLELEHHNLRAALSWFCDQQQIDHAVRMSAALWRFWQMRGHLTEGRERIETVLALAEQAGDPSLRLTALDAAGGIA
jgi:predicted ATPase